MVSIENWTCPEWEWFILNVRIMEGIVLKWGRHCCIYEIKWKFISSSQGHAWFCDVVTINTIAGFTSEAFKSLTRKLNTWESHASARIVHVNRNSFLFCFIFWGYSRLHISLKGFFWGGNPMTSLALSDGEKKCRTFTDKKPPCSYSYALSQSLSNLPGSPQLWFR